MYMKRIGLFSLLVFAGCGSDSTPDNTTDAATVDAATLIDATALVCDPGFYGADCLGQCSCVQGTCDDGATGTGDCSCTLGFGGDDCDSECTLSWEAAPTGPIVGLDYDNALPKIAWNDATVLKDAEGYRMWLSGGDPLGGGKGPPPVELFEASSADGLSWTVNTTPVLEPSDVKGNWDDHAVETPSVIVDGNGVYHMYYSGSRTGQAPGVYQIGHATSPDGTVWTKDLNNPVISTVAAPESSDWGVFSVAEPGAVYDPVSDEIRVYYASAGGSVEHNGDYAILLATSSDGSTFTHHRDAAGNREPVWSLSDSYTPLAEWRGISTPAVVRSSDGVYHLTHDLVKNPMGFEQVGVSYAKSNDGISFEEVSVNIVKLDDQPWMSFQVLAPYMLIEEDKLVLWFSANAIPAPLFVGWTHGIARVDGTYSCL